MKFILFLGSLLSLEVFADSIISERVVSLPVSISSERVKLSRRGYSWDLVKILVPELADVTIANHRNPGESAPCLANYEAYSTDEIIQNRPEVILTPFTITLSKNSVIDEERKICKVTLKESIVGFVRGFKFVHDRIMTMPERHLDDCR